MSGTTDPDDAGMQKAVAALLAGPDETISLRGWKRVLGGNARRAWRFDAHRSDGGATPCIMLSQVAAKHVESDTAAEYAVLAALNGSGVRAPAALALDAAGAVCGAPAIVLERVEGEASAVDFLKMPKAAGRALSNDLARATADLHRFDWQAAGLTAGSDNPVATQIARWDDTFHNHRLEPHPVLAWLFRWLRANAPVSPRLSLVHGDLRPGNFLYQRDRVTALLDWEMAHIGDPAEDIAWIYRALWSPQRFVSLDDFLAAHAKQAGFAIPRRNVIFYRIFSEVKFAAISVSAAHSVATAGTRNLRHIDRAAKIPECLRLALGWISAYEQEVRDAAA